MGSCCSRDDEDLNTPNKPSSPGEGSSANKNSHAADEKSLETNLANASVDDIEKALSSVSASSQLAAAIKQEKVTENASGRSGEEVTQRVDTQEELPGRVEKEELPPMPPPKSTPSEQLAPTEQLKQTKPEASVSLIDVAATLANASPDDTEKALCSLSATILAKLAAVVKQEKVPERASGKPGEEGAQQVEAQEELPGRFEKEELPPMPPPKSTPTEQLAPSEHVDKFHERLQAFRDIVGIEDDMDDEDMISTSSEEHATSPHAHFDFDALEIREAKQMETDSWDPFGDPAATSLAQRRC